MKSQLQSGLILSLLMVAAHAHCVVTHAEELAVMIEASTEEMPLDGNSQPCENAGCLCKGALVGELTMAVLEQDDSVQWLSGANFALTPNSAVAIDVSECSKPFSVASHFSGVTARALLQSFQV